MGTEKMTPEQIREQKRQWNAENREKLREYHRQKYAANPDAKRRYYQTHRDERLAYQHKYNDAHRDALLAYAEKYRDQNRIRIRNTYRAKVLGIDDPNHPDLDRLWQERVERIKQAKETHKERK